MTGLEGAVAVLRQAVAERLFPAASFEFGWSAGALATDAIGSLTFDDGAPPARADTPFDLASLTKPVATTTMVLRLAAAGVLGLDDRVSDFLPDWHGADRASVTVQDLLEHASGLPPRLVDPPPEGRREFEHEICALPLEYAPRAQSVYSDLGFILLGFLIADRGGMPFDAQFNAVVERLAVREPALAREPLGFSLSASLRRRTAPTEPLPDDRRRGRRLRGEVHDPYAAALGGVAGHAGLFGTAASVGAFARSILCAARGDTSPALPLGADLVARAARRSTVPASSRALGWDTMLPTSSCGQRMSAAAFGHVGFTGTSLWIDPPRDRYVVLLANRACGGGTIDDMRTVRRAFHDALADV